MRLSGEPSLEIRDAMLCYAKSLQSCPTLRPHRQQPTRLQRPWDSPGKNTGVGCHFLLQCMKEKSESEVAQLCPFFSCMAWRAIPGPLSKRKRRLESLEAAQGAPRDPRRDSRGDRSPWLPLETRPDSPGEPGMQPRDPCLPWRGKLGPGHTLR